MPRMRVCSCIGCPAHDGSCPELTESRRCTACAGQAELRRGRRQARGYGADHTRRRSRIAPQVELGQTKCARCGQLILPGQEWAMDHNDDRTGYLGPSHATCNNRAGGLAAHQT